MIYDLMAGGGATRDSANSLRFLSRRGVVLLKRENRKRKEDTKTRLKRRTWVLNPQCRARCREVFLTQTAHAGKSIKLAMEQYYSLALCALSIMMKNFDPSPPSRLALRVYLRFLPRFAFAVGPITDADGLFPPVCLFPFPPFSLSLSFQLAPPKSRI